MSSVLVQKLKKLMKIGVVTDSIDSTSYPVLFVKYLGKTLARAVNFTPFGLWSRPTDGSMSMLFNMNGSESNKFAITNELKNRPVKNLAKGEAVVGNLLSYFHFKADGSVSLIVNGSEVIGISDDGIISITGAVNIDGALTATGVIQGSDLTNGFVPYTTHVHADPVSGVTGAPQ